MNMNHRASILLILIGLSGLFIYEQQYRPDRVDIRDIEREDIGENVIVHGTVNNVNVKDSITFISLSKRDDLDIVSFRKQTELKKNDTVTLHGTVDLYHGTLEIVVDHLSIDREAGREDNL